VRGVQPSLDAGPPERALTSHTEHFQRVPTMGAAPQPSQETLRCVATAAAATRVTGAPGPGISSQGCDASCTAEAPPPPAAAAFREWQLPHRS